MFSNTIPCEIFHKAYSLGENRGEIAARFWPPRFPHLAEIAARYGNLGGQNAP